MSNDVIVMCSGGSDSMYLLHLISNKMIDGDNTVYCVYINHGISKEEPTWRKLVINFCKTYDNVEFVYHKINWNDKFNQSETQCRALRYDFVQKFAIEKHITEIYTGHHKNDLMENNLISIFKNRVYDFDLCEKVTKKINNNGDVKFLNFYKPLLKFSKNEIIDNCYELKINFVTDESNVVSNNIRNVLRNNLFPNINKLKDSKQYISSMMHFFTHYNQLNSYLLEDIKYVMDNSILTEIDGNKRFKIKNELIKENTFFMCELIKMFNFKYNDEKNNKLKNKADFNLLNNYNKIKEKKSMFKLNEKTSFIFDNNGDLFIFIKK